MVPLDSLLSKITQTRTMVDRADMVAMLDIMEGIIKFLQTKQPIINHLTVRKEGA